MIQVPLPVHCCGFHYFCDIPVTCSLSELLSLISAPGIPDVVQWSGGVLANQKNENENQSVCYCCAQRADLGPTSLALRSTCMKHLRCFLGPSQELSFLQSNAQDPDLDPGQQHALGGRKFLLLFITNPRG